MRPDGDRLILEVSDRGRRAGGVPEETTRLPPGSLQPRLDSMRQLAGELSRRGEVTQADRASWKAHGQVLYDLLVPPALRRLLRDAAGESLWLRLRGRAVDLPWEWLDDGDGAWCDRYALGREVPVTPGPHFRPGGAIACPARTVVLGDCAGDLPQARLEVDAVHRALRAVGLRPRTQSGELLADDVRVTLRAADILHVAAHVDPSPAATEPSRGAGIRCVDGHLREADLATMGGTGAFPALVVLNGCRSSVLAASLLAAGTGHVIGTTAEVGDEAARQVAVALFSELAVGRSLGEALRRARAATTDPLLAASYLLYGDPDVDLAAAFPSSEVDGRQAEGPSGPAAWLGASIHLDKAGEDSSGSIASLAPLRQRLLDLLEALGLSPSSDSSDTVVVRLGLDEFGDGYGDAALEAARRLVDARLGAELTDWTGNRMARLGIGLCGADKARSRAAWLAELARTEAPLVDEHLRALCRDPSARWSRHPLATGVDRRVWRLTFGGPQTQPSPTFVGRRTTLDHLSAFVEEAVESGRPQLAVVTGPAGIGKTALLDTFEAQLPLGTAVVRGSVGLLGGFSVRGAVPPSDPEDSAPPVRSRATSLVAGLVEASQSDRLPEGPGDEAWRWAADLGEHGQPLVWLVDGADRLDAAFVTELESLLDELEERALCIVLAMRTDRPEDKARAERLALRSASVPIGLAPLLVQEARQLLRQRLAIDSVPAELEPLIERAGGNPLVLLSAVEHYQREGVLRRPGRGLLVDPARVAAVPPSPIEEALVAARLRALPSIARATLEAIGIFGGEAPVAGLESLPMVKRQGLQAAAALGWTRRRTAASSSGREVWVSLREPLVARVLPGLVPSARSRALHDAVLAWLEASGAPPSERARHALRSSHPLQAVLPLWQEALGCQGGGDFEGVLAALDPLERLIATAPEADLAPGTPAPGTIRALRDAAEHAIQVELDPTVLDSILAISSSGFEPIQPRRIGRYEVLDAVAIGGTGTVYLAEQEGPGGFSRKVALKILHRQLAANPVFVRSFVAEARIAARLTHPNIVGVTDLGQVGELWYLAMDFVDGCSSRELLGGCPEGLPADIALSVASGAAAGLAHAHAMPDGPVIHRDVCPESVLVGLDGVPRVFDFGLATAADRLGPPTETGTLRGRAGYAAPERLDGGQLGPAADLWSLGVVLYELLTGRPLFGGRTILQVLDAVLSGELEPALLRLQTLDEELGHWMRRILVRDPADRLADARALADAFDRMALRLSPFQESPSGRLAQLVRDVRDGRRAAGPRIGS